MNVIIYPVGCIENVRAFRDIEIEKSIDIYLLTKATILNRIDDLFAGLTGMRHENFINELDYTCDSSCVSMSQKSKYSNSSSSGTDCSEQPSCQYSLLENTPKNFQMPISPPKNFQPNSNNSFTR